MDSFFAIERLSAFLDDELPPAEMAEVRAAIAENDEVRDAYEALKRNRQWVAEHVDATPPESLRARVFAELASIEEARESAPSGWARWGLSWSTLRVGVATASVALLAYVIIVPDATLLLHHSEQNADYARAPGPETSADSLAAPASEAPAEEVVESLSRETMALESTQSEAPPAAIRADGDVAGALAEEPAPTPARQGSSSPKTASAGEADFGGGAADALQNTGLDQAGGLGSRGYGAGGGGSVPAGMGTKSTGAAPSAEDASEAVAKAPTIIDFEGVDAEPVEQAGETAAIAYEDEDGAPSAAKEKRSRRTWRSAPSATEADVEPMPALALVTYRVYTSDVNAVLHLRDKVETSGAQLRSTSGRSFSPKVLSSEDNYAKVQVKLPTDRVQAVLDHLQSLGAATHVSGSYGNANEVQLHIEIIYQP